MLVSTPGSRRGQFPPDAQPAGDRIFDRVSQIWLCRKHLYICKSLNQSYLITAKPTTVAYENNDKKMDSIYSKRIRAGKRRTYFFDVRTTRGNDYYLTITESRKRFDDNGYDRHKVFLYKEDFNKFIKALTEAVDYVKTELMPDFDFDAFNHDDVAEGVESEGGEVETTAIAASAPEAPAAEVVVVPDATTIETSGSNAAHEEVDKW